MYGPSGPGYTPGVAAPGLPLATRPPIVAIGPPLPPVRGGGPIANGYNPPLAAMSQNGGSVGRVGTPLGALGNLVPAALPAAVPAALGALGLGGLTAGLGTLYGLSQAIGVQYPWETGAGEGFIAPWERDLVKDEAGRWVGRETRPDLFIAGPSSTAMVPAGGQVTVSVPAARGIVKRWDTGYTDAQGVRHAGWPFAMTADADGKHKRIHTVNKDGVPVSWTPFRPIVLGKKLSGGMAKRAVRKLQSIVQLGKDIEKLGGTRVVYRSKK